MDKKEKVLLATLELASEKGLGSISLSQIAKKVGIQKPGLYNHFSSKEELIQSMYEYVRRKAKENSGFTVVDYAKVVENKDAEQILTSVIESYINMAQKSEMAGLFQVIAAESKHEPIAAKIMLEETQIMAAATKQLFYEMQEQKKLHFPNTAIAATIFAMTVHSLMDTVHYQTICGQPEEESAESNSYAEFIKEFVRIYEVK